MSTYVIDIDGVIGTKGRWSVGDSYIRAKRMFFSIPENIEKEGVMKYSNENIMDELIRGNAKVQIEQTKPLEATHYEKGENTPSTITIKLVSQEERQKRLEKIKEFYSIKHHFYKFTLKESSGKWFY